MYKAFGTLYDTRSDLITALCYEWLTAGGSNSLEWCREQMECFGAEDLTIEMITDGWGAEQIEAHDIDRSELIDAMEALDLSDEN